MNTRKKIVVGMSGGVDSSVAALALIEQGHEVSGLFMKNWEEDDDNGQCTATTDLADAQQVCDTLGIPLRTVNFSAEYWDHVFENFLQEYNAGRTPNPDILCNKYIKFKAFLEFASEMGAELIATGHFVQIQQKNDSHRLIKGRDPNKDQSYFLYTLGQAQLARCEFPIGEMTKPDVRKKAESAGFKNFKKKDSTGICFIGERKFRNFLQRFLPARPGEIQNTKGQVIGDHHGLMYYTLGQRQGLGIGGISGASEQPWYVLGKDLRNNVLVIGQGQNHPLMFHNCLTAANLHWVEGSALEKPLRCKAKTRYRQADQSCRVEPSGNGACQVVFDSPQRAMTPGQSVVFYRSEECLGGGIIESVRNLQGFDRAQPIAIGVGS